MAVNTVTVTINGQTINLTAGSNNTWSGTVTAPTKSSGSNNSGKGVDIGGPAKNLGYYPVTATATDVAGNSVTVGSDDATLGTSLRLKVLEKTKPVTGITYPTNGAYVTNSKPTIKFTAYDAGSGVNPSKCYLKIDSGTAVAVAVKSGAGTSSDKYVMEYTPSTALSEGTHTITCYCIDYDGNQSTNATSTFTVDTVPPSLNISAPTQNLVTNVNPFTVVGTTSDATSNPVTVTVKVNNGSAQAVTVSSGAFSKAVTLTEGANTITVVATDAAGKSTTVTRNVTLDTVAPVISAITLTPNPVDGGATLTVTVTVTDS